MRRLLPAVSQGIALFVGAIALLDLLSELRSPGLHASLWLLDLRALPRPLSLSLFAVFSLVLVAHGLRPARDRRWALLTRAVALTALLAALINTLAFWALLAQHQLYSGFPFPLSLGLALLMALIAGAPPHPKAPPKHYHNAVFATVTLLALAAPLALMIAFGRTDYRRPADAIIVLGARTYADGRPSNALTDRVLTACELYHHRYARRLIFSGAEGDGAVSEPQAMRALALSRGVSARDITLDERGANTDATVRNTLPILRTLGARRVLVVSHAYHLPRVKLAFQREGQEVFTVPARERRMLIRMPYFMAREVIALWVYYARAVSSRR